MASRKRYNDEFKRSAVELAIQSMQSPETADSLPQTAKNLGISATALRNWVDEARSEKSLVKIDSGSDMAKVVEELQRENRQLRMERDILKKSDGVLREGPAVRLDWVERHEQEFPVTVMCRMLDVAPAAYHARKANKPRSDARAAENQARDEAVAAAYELGRGAYGSPRVHLQLCKQGDKINQKTVAKIMRGKGLRSVRCKARRRIPQTTDSSHRLPIAQNILDREFHADEPNRKWVCDITYIETREGFLYLAVIIDLFSRKVVGWAMADHMRVELVSAALRMALEHRDPDAGLIVHSDRGVQYAARLHRQALEAMGLVCSMSARGECLDNAVAESFNGTLKTELVHHQDFKTHAEAKAVIFEWIEVFYNRVRIHTALGDKSPEEFEQAAAVRMS